MEDSKGAIILLAVLGIVGLFLLTRKQSVTAVTDQYNQWERVDGPTIVPPNIRGDPTLYQNEKRIKIIRGEDGHIEELVIHHTIKQNSLSQIPEGVFEV